MSEENTTRPSEVVATPAERSHSRMIEDIGFAAGIIQGLFYGALEALKNAGWTLGKCEQVQQAVHSFPWVTITIMALCVAPKMVGRATAGKAWSGLANLLPGNRGNA